MTVFSLFPVDILVHDVSPEEQQWIREQVEPWLATADLRVDQTRHMVKTTYDPQGVNDIRDHRLQALQNVLTEQLSAYLRHFTSTDPASLCESWLNVYEQGGYMSDHEHPGCKISGVYYYQAEPGSGDLYFRNPNPLMLNHIWPGNVRTELASDCVPAQTGRLVMFPSWLVHSVGTCVSTKISISFNYK